MDKRLVRIGNLSSSPAGGFIKSLSRASRWFALTATVMVFGLAEWRVLAKPRIPFPPVPEPAVLRHFRFDEALYPFLTASAPLNAQNAQTRESWSGLALRMAGQEAAILQYPEVEKDGRTNINCRVGSVRFWFKPDWTSGSLGGKGPETFARLIEMGAPSKDGRTGWWSLYLNPQGNSIYFSAQGNRLSADYLQAPIQWWAGTWHEVLLMYDAGASRLFIDGELAGEGAGVSVWPDAEVRSALGFAIGSDMAGSNLAQGEFDELTTYSRPLGLMEWEWVYRMRATQAARGAISPEEEQQLRMARQQATNPEPSGELMFFAASGPPAPGGGSGTNGGGGGTISNPPPYSVPGLKVSIPKLVNQGGNFAFWVLEPQSNAVYELQFATNLNSPISWTTLTRGLHGQTNYIISRPMASNGFFRLRVPYVAGPPVLVVPEDTSVVVPNVQVNGFTGSVGTVSLRVTNGFVKLTTTNGLTLSGNSSANLAAVGTYENLNAALLTLRYQGDTNYFGPDGLTATLTNAGPSGTISEVLKVGITVTPVNDTPTANGNSYTVAEDTTLLIQAPGVLSGDSDPEGDPITAALVSGPSHGILTLSSDGSFTYLPNLNYNGSDSFQYQANDAGSGGGATVNLTITDVNDPPTVTLNSPANGASIAVGVGINLGVSVADIDGTVSSVSYYNGSNSIGSESSPFSLVWTNPGLGTYTLTAQATDNAGAVGASLPVTFSVSADCDSDGISDAVEIIQGTNPCDVFNGATPILSIVGGNYQTGAAAVALPQLLKVRVSNSTGIAAVNSPVTFAVTDGGGFVSASTNGPWTNSISISTDTNGVAGAACLLPLAGVTLVQASAGSNASIARVTFAEAVAGPIDSWVLENYPVAISAGGEHTLALMLDGTIRAWGNNWAGQLGSGITNSFSSTPLVVPGLSNVMAISAGAWHSLALKSDGTVSVWGEYWEDQLPTPPSGLSSVVTVSGGTGHSMALKNDGTVSTWGSSFDNHHTPPSGLSAVRAIAAGHGFSLALKSNGTVVAWGLSSFYLNYGQTNVPAGLASVQAIAAGGYHAMALSSNGTVVAWGRNNHQQTNVPAGLGNVIAIDAGEFHSLALKSDGTVAAWGNNDSGQVGQYTNLNNVTAISAGGLFGVSHSVALKTDHTVRSWGANSYGQLGNGSQTSSSTPVQALGLPPPASTNYGVQFKVYTPLK